MSGHDPGQGAGASSPHPPHHTTDLDLTQIPPLQIPPLQIPPLQVPPLEDRRRPFAVGVLRVPAGAGVVIRTAERLAVALAAHTGGYFLLDIIEVTSGSAPEDWARLWALAATTDAEVFLVRGPLPRHRVEAFATELRMAIRDVAPPPPRPDPTSLDPPVGAGA